MFDCVLPTRNARHGTLFVWNDDPSKVDLSSDFYSKLIITNEANQFDQSPIDPHCDCVACQTTSRAYLRHLFAANEMLGKRLATNHNISFYLQLMKELRKQI